MTTYAIVGATSLPLAEVSGHILRMMTMLKPGTDKIVVRGRRMKDETTGKSIPLAGPDSMVAVFATVLHLDLEIEPLPNGPVPASPDILRAVNIVEKADVVWALFDSLRGHVGGTSHVLTQACARNKPAIAFDYLPDRKEFVKTGEWDPE